MALGGRTTLITALLLPLASCDSETPEEAYDRGYYEGYEDGQYELCREVESVSMAIARRLEGCEGF